MLIESPLAAALNHLLAAEPWARERLAPFEGETLELRAPPLPALRLTVGAGGWLAPASERAAASLAIALKPGALAALLKGEEHLLAGVEMSGNTRLASEVMFLLRHLRWDAEEDLAKWVGDAPAHRLVAFAREAAGLATQAARRVAEGAVEYAIEERPILVPRALLAEHSAALAQLRDAIERLEKRIERLEPGG